MDKHYESMIQDITNNASDREQLIIISRLVDCLRAWQIPYTGNTVEELYATSLTQIKTIIDETLKKEDELNDKSNI